MANEADDRLAGDLVWELFPDPAPRTALNARRVGRWVALAVLVVVEWFVCPPLAVVVICCTVAAGDFRNGRQLARTIPDKAGGAICSRFAYAWGAAKFTMAAFALMLAAIFATTSEKNDAALSAFFAASMLGMASSLGSAALTASGLFRAFRSGMRVWVGEGINQARSLMLGMLITAFAFGVLGPLTLWLAVGLGQQQALGPIWAVLGFVGCVFGAPIFILIVLDWLSRHVVADRPGKFGAKVPAVGKWNS